MKTLSALFYYLVLVGVAYAQGTVLITFDDLPQPTSLFYSAVLPVSYAGLQWNNFAYVDAQAYYLKYGDAGDYNGMASTPNVALNRFGTNAWISGGTFDMKSAYLGGAWNDGLQVEVQGFLGGTLKYDNTYTVNTTNSTLINFNYLGVDSMRFDSFGGVPHGYPNASGTQFVLDNLTVNLIPEPSSIALATVGTVGMVLLMRLRQAR